MPKEVHEIKKFITGTITSADVRDIPEDAASYSLNVDSTSEDGKVRAVPNDKIIVPYLERDENGNYIDYPTGTNEESVLSRAFATSLAVINNDEQHDLLYYDNIVNQFSVIKDIYSLDYDSNNITKEIIGKELKSDTQSIAVNGHRAYVGMGLDERPQWAGYIKHSNMLSSTGKGELICIDADLEEFGLNSGQYSIDKWCKAFKGGTDYTIAPTNDNKLNQIHMQSGTSAFIYGVQRGTKYIYRMPIDGTVVAAADDYGPDANLSVNIERSNEIYLDGEVLDDTFTTIATCKSHAGCVWVGTTNGAILKVNIADAYKGNNNIPETQLFSNLETGGSGREAFKDETNFQFSKHCHVVSTINVSHEFEKANGTVLGDIVESGNNFTDDQERCWNLFVSYYKEDFFVDDDRFLYSAKVWSNKNWEFSHSDDIVGGGDEYAGFEPLLGDVFMLFKDKSPLIKSVKTLRTRRKKDNGYRTIAYNPKLLKFKNSEGWVKRGPGKYTSGHDKVAYRNGDSAEWYDWDDADGYTDDETSKTIVGRNIGWLDKSEIQIARYGLIDMWGTRRCPNVHNVDGYSRPKEGMVGLLAYSNTDFVTSGGIYRSEQCGVGDRTWTGWSNYVSKNMGIFMYMLSGVDANKGADTDYKLKVQELDYSDTRGPVHQITHGPDKENDGIMWMRKLSSTAQGMEFSNITGISTDDLAHQFNYAIFDTDNNSGARNSFFIAEKYGDVEGNFNKTKIYGQHLNIETEEDFLVNGNLYTHTFDVEDFNDDTIATPVEIDSGSCTILNYWEDSSHYGYDVANRNNESQVILANSKTAAFVSNGDGSGGAVNGFANTDASGADGWDATVDSSGNFKEFTGVPGIISFAELESGTDGPFEGGKTYRYKVAFEYDNLQIGPLSSNSWGITTSGTATTKYKAIRITLSLESLPPRVTRLFLYRKDEIDSLDTEAGSFMNVTPFGINVQGGWTQNLTHNIYTKAIIDKGRPGSDYIAESGIEPSFRKLLPNYTLSTRMNDYLFIAKCKVPGESDDFRQHIFRSIGASNWNVFDWVNEFLVLPSIPTALSSFKGRLIAFDKNNSYVIDGTGQVMSVIDTLEGVGCLSQDSVISTEWGLFIADDSNIYMFDGSKTLPIGNSILDASGDSFSYAWNYRDKSVDPKLTFDGRRGSLFVAFSDAYGNPYVWSYQVYRKRWDLLDVAMRKQGNIKIWEKEFNTGINKITVIEDSPGINLEEIFNNTIDLQNQTPKEGLITNITKGDKYLNRIHKVYSTNKVGPSSIYIPEQSEALTPYEILLEANSNMVSDFIHEDVSIEIWSGYQWANERPYEFSDKFAVEITNSDLFPYYTIGTEIRCQETKVFNAGGWTAVIEDVIEKQDSIVIIFQNNIFTPLQLWDTFETPIVDTQTVRHPYTLEYLTWYKYGIKFNFIDYQITIMPHTEPSVAWVGNLDSLEKGNYNIRASASCTLQNNEATNSIEIENNVNPFPSALITGQNGEVLLCDGYRILNFLGGEGRKQWSWHSKDITFNEDNKFKKIYNTVVSSNIDALISNEYVEIPIDANLSEEGQGSVYAKYSVNGFPETFNFLSNGSLQPEHKKAKSIKIKIDSLEIIDNQETTGTDEGVSSSSELSSISMFYRRLPNTNANF